MRLTGHVWFSVLGSEIMAAWMHQTPERTGIGDEKKFLVRRLDFTGGQDSREVGSHPVAWPCVKRIQRKFQL
jgi:hypothetical protein